MSCGPTSQFNCHKGPLGPSLTDICTGSKVFGFISLLNALILKNDKISGKCERVVSVERPNYEYDFVVVGGGAAGSAVTARLSENPQWKVLLLEAGPDEPAGTEVPGFNTQFLGTNIIWNYTTTNETYSCLSTNGSCPWPQGKNLGGNTAHNGMIYIRGNPTDYNKWAEKGNEGWTWKEVEPFFLKAEDNGEVDRVGRKHHATGGPLSVERFPYVPPMGHSFLKASEEAGFGVSEDLNGDVKTGFSIIQGMNKHGVRHSSSRSYLWPIRNRKNLHISLNSHATKLIIQNGRAVGVEYYKNGELRTVYVKKEVIVSGGTVESPHLLLLSGIGPKEQLESVGIKVIIDLPGVGENLHDHACAVIPFTVNEPDVYDNDYSIAADYLIFQNGPLSGIGTVQSLALLASNETSPDYPDLEIYFRGYSDLCGPGKIGALRSSGKRTITLLPSVLHPKSRGRITLKSNDPFDYPTIWTNHLGHPDDMARMVDGIRISLALLDTEALSDYNFTLTDAPLEACANYEFNSDEYWACVASQKNFHLCHEGGTCKMGPLSDPMAVVDPRFRVHGIKGLRVVDNSILPEAISGNTAAPAMMLGERAAHFIKEDY